MTNRIFGAIAATALIALGTVATAHAQIQTAIQSGTFAGNGNNSFGGAVGTSSLTINQPDPASNIVNFSIPVTNPATPFNDNLVIYLATQNTQGTGFNNTATIVNDTADGGRTATSGNAAPLTFAAGFTADYALVMGSFGSVLFGLTPTLANPTQLAFLDFQGTGGSYNLDITQIGIQRGQYFDFFGTYNANSSYRSNEFIGITSFNQITGSPDGTGSIGQNAATLGAGSFNRLVTVPEAGSLAFVLPALGVLGAVVARRRK